MSFKRHKKLKSGQTAVYEVTSYWDSEKKQSRCSSKYLGLLDDQNLLVSKGKSKRGPRKKEKVFLEREKLILDFGNGFWVYEFIKKSSLFRFLEPILAKIPALISLMVYRICQSGPMYNAQEWRQGNAISFLEKNVSLSSQDISRYLTYLGHEEVQRVFFKSYLHKDNLGGSKNIIIDATSLQNSIHSEFNAWGYSDGHVDQQFRFHFVVDQIRKMPLFYRFVPGNISDVSTLQTTLQQLEELGLKQNFALLDAGYASEENIKDLRVRQINFLMRLPAGRSLYKKMVLKHAHEMESLKNSVIFGSRSLFIKKFKVDDLYGAEGYIYMVLDPDRKAKEIQKVIHKSQQDKKVKKSSEKNKTPEELKKAEKIVFKIEENNKYAFLNAGIFMLISSQEIEINDVLSAYYTRQSIEQIFGFSKDNLDILPIRCHNNETIQGYFFLQFLLLVVYIGLRETIKEKYTVEQAIIIMRALKCKVYDNKIVISEATKMQKEIFEAAEILVPSLVMGI